MKKSETKRELWARRVRARAASGASRQAFCRGLGVHPTTMLYWERQLKGNAAVRHSKARSLGGGFTKVERVALDPVLPPPGRSVVRLPSGVSVEYEGWPQAMWLGELSRAMASTTTAAAVAAGCEVLP